MGTVAQYLSRRHVNLQLERTATFLLYSLSGRLVGYQQHRPDARKSNQKLSPKAARYFTYRKQPTHGVFDPESLHLGEGPVFLTEGVFDACRLTSLGQSALAVCCNDPAGRKLAKFGHYSEFCPEPGQDLGDCPQDFVNYLLNKYC